jgi:hypothetical protein
VDDIHVHGDATLVRRLDELLERIGAAVGVFDGELVARVVAPAVPARELVDGHEQNAVHAHFFEVIKLGDGIAQGGRFAIAGSRVEKSSRMHLVDDKVLEQRDGFALGGVTPIERCRVINNAVFFVLADLSGARVAPGQFTVDKVKVFVARLGVADIG